MTQPTSTTRFPRENILGLIFVAIAIGLIVNDVYLAEASASWLGAASQLEPNVQTASFLIGTGSQISFVIVNATLENQSDNGQISLIIVYYRVFVNSTMASFSVRGSSVVATSGVSFGKIIPARSSVNITAAVRITTDTVSDLSNFLSSYNDTIRTFVGLDFQLQSSYISVLKPTCTELPARIPVDCPALRP